MMRITFEKVRHKTKHVGQSLQDWLTILFQPDQFFIRVNAGEIKNGFVPMALLSLVIILQSTSQWAALSCQNQTTQSSFSLPVMVIFNLGTLWITWLWVSSILRSFLILTGIRCLEWQPRVIIAWLFAPLTLRYAVRLAFNLITGAAITTPGLSGFMAQPDSFIDIFTSQILSQIDLYLIWHILLLWIGLKHLPTIQPTQQIIGLILTVLNMVILFSLLGSLAAIMQIS